MDFIYGKGVVVVTTYQMVETKSCLRFVKKRERVIIISFTFYLKVLTQFKVYISTRIII